MAEMVPVTIIGVVGGTEDDAGGGSGSSSSSRRPAATPGARIGVGDAEAMALAFSLQGQELRADDVTS